jgi:hypothetical protein
VRWRRAVAPTLRRLHVSIATRQRTVLLLDIVDNSTTFA